MGGVIYKWALFKGVPTLPLIGIKLKAKSRKQNREDRLEIRN